jgi:hypothetical protein
MRADWQALGFDRVAEAYRGVVADAQGTPLDAAGVIFGGHKRLYRIPDVPRETPQQASERETRELRALAAKGKDRP